MNIEKNIHDEISSIEEIISQASLQYQNEDTSPNVIPPDYHVLFILVKNVSVNGTVYSTTAALESVFYEAVDNFKGSVENFTNHNVNIIPTIKTISSTITTWDTSHSIHYENMYSILKDFTSPGLYDAVIVVTAPCGILGVTSFPTFSYSRLLYGFTHSIIYANDVDRAGQGYSNDYPHLTTTNIFIHEWMHQLECYRNSVSPIYPDTHAYGDPESYGYSYDSSYFDDDTLYPHVVEPNITSFYRAVLSAEITYTNGTLSRKIGMFPTFWKITPRKIMIGRYILQNVSGDYYYRNNNSYSTSGSLSNGMDYIWNIYYSLSSNSLKIQNFGADYNDPTVTLPETYTNLLATRVGPYDEGEYILVNKTLSEKLLGYTMANNFSMYSYRANSLQSFKLEYYSELYFKLQPMSLSNKYFDLNNVADYEDNTVSLGSWTGYADAQTWQFRYDGSNYKIMPKASPTRSLSYHDSALHITSVSNIQNWRPEYVPNGKFIIEGTYKFKAVNGGYLRYLGNVVRLFTTGTNWKVTYAGDNYYKISYQSGTITYYLDVLNAYDIEGNTIGISQATGYDDAQTWKFMLNNDGTVTLVPRLSLLRGLNSTTTGSTLSSSQTKFTLLKM